MDSLHNYEFMVHFQIDNNVFSKHLKLIILPVVIKYYKLSLTNALLRDTGQYLTKSINNIML